MLAGPQPWRPPRCPAAALLEVPMLAPGTQLATAAEIRAIHRRAVGILDAIAGRDDDDGYAPDQHRLDNRQLNAAIEALRFCCVAAGELGDATLLPLVAE